MGKKISRFWAETSGSVAVIIGISLAVVAGFAALAIDLGHLGSVKSELQQAADAGALGGARALITQVPAAVPFVNKPNFVDAPGIATDTVKLNYADGNVLANADVQAGYWDLTWHWNTAPKDATTGAINLLPTTTPADPTRYVPAVRVKVDKAEGSNSGPVSNYLAGVIGTPTSKEAAQSVAGVFKVEGKGISSVPAQSCFPFAVPIKWVNDWQTNHLNDDPPLTVVIGSDYHAEDGGQWTSFLIDANNVPTIRDLINNGNPTPLSTGDQIWIQPGTKDTLFSDMSVDEGKIGLLPVVPDDYATHDYTTLLGFVAFYLDDAVGGAGKYIKGHFVKDYVDYDGTPGTPTNNYGAAGAKTALIN
jgi:Flp pilus assembly protein TadG